MREEVIIKLIYAENFDFAEEEICNAIEESHSINFPFDVNFDSKKRFREMVEYVKKGDAKVAVAFLGNKIVGYVWYFTTKYSRVHINEIAVLEGMKGRHIGTALLKYVEEYAWEEGIEIIELFCMENNEVAKAFYKSNCFITEKRLLIKKL